MSFLFSFSFALLSRRTSGCNATWGQWTETSFRSAMACYLERVYLGAVACVTQLLALFPHTKPTDSIKPIRCATLRFRGGYIPVILRDFVGIL